MAKRIPFLILSKLSYNNSFVKEVASTKIANDKENSLLGVFQSAKSAFLSFFLLSIDDRHAFPPFPTGLFPS